MQNAIRGLMKPKQVAVWQRRKRPKQISMRSMLSPRLPAGLLSAQMLGLSIVLQQMELDSHASHAMIKQGIKRLSHQKAVLLILGAGMLTPA